MKANELRVTNFVDYNGPIAVIMIGYDSVELIETNGKTFTKKLDLIKPIPLTEDWLVRFGFVQGEQRGYFPPKFSKKYTPVLVENKFTVEFIDEHILMWLEGNTNVHMKYVHQLQNLYFALTGTELALTGKKS